MRLRAKTAISIPKEFLEKIEKIRKHTHQTRSQIITEALWLWFKTREESGLEDRYAQGYKKIPEDISAAESFFKAGLSGFGKEKW